MFLQIELGLWSVKFMLLDDNVAMYVLMAVSFFVLVFILVINMMLFVFVGSAITGPIGKECADLWPRIASAANAIV
jgi:hypothetical protein